MRPTVPVPFVVATLTAVLAGCGGSSSDAKDPAADSGRSTASAAPTVDPATVCPPKLARGDDPDGHGFGAQEDAQEQPTLPAPERAWTCRYDPVDSAQTQGGGTELAWVLHGRAAAVAAPELSALDDALQQVVPFADGSRVCTADLGPRWMVVYPGDDGLVGVVVDDYGCREVRLTDDPAATPPGEGEGDGTVPGVLDGGADVLTALGLGRG
ncbi:hypothetical protein ASC77_22735 [Nocardioides sp. Root1257]|uniref:hypothetical protein n=1 Tax=unclassified Nocardioides TaxID=2615069 RepID=UPI0006FFA6D6|nr:MULTISPECIES: hypothetical protein [unclassified Nocardioides]KQW43104.1 hypothetical protein ASC77_22735 [Nocardioides sp. Root1257]KRC41972.1 hypothetical protein ASE24_22525 [Nocardioides sp. Root224]